MGVALPRFTEGQIRDLTVKSGEMVNEVTILYSYNWTDGKFRSSITKHNPLSKVLYGTKEKSLELRMVQSTRQAEKIADAILLTSSIPPLQASFKHDLRSLSVEVGDEVTLTHSGGIGENGFVDAPALVLSNSQSGGDISYVVLLKQQSSLYASELLTLTQTVGATKESFSVQYEKGVATITIYADVQGSPPVEGAEVTIGGVKKVTDKKGQVRFNLQPGRYKAIITANGYEDAEITFTV
jgi:hypothetical protein